MHQFTLLCLHCLIAALKPDISKVEIFLASFFSDKTLLEL